MLASAIAAAVLAAPASAADLVPAADDAPSAPAPAAPPPAAASPVAVPAPAPVATAPLRLRMGSRGAMVRDLQRELRRRGARLTVDGVYGRGTYRAVRWIQARHHMRVTGIADAALMRRMGLQTLTVAGLGTATGLPSWVRMQVWPARGEMSSPFGPRWGRMHEGQDIASRYGTPILAASSGTVVFTGWYGGYGNLVRIDHGNGLETRYGHLSAIAVRVGDRVAAGQPIGRMGSTGNSTGVHLHFEVRLGGRAFDPVPTLPGPVTASARR